MSSRKQLGALDGQRIAVTAIIDRYGQGPTSSQYLLLEVRDAATGSLLTDHLWMDVGRWADGFRPKDQIQFTACVAPYVKGWMGDSSRRPEFAPPPSIDWTLTDVSDAQIVAFGPQQRMMPDGSIRPQPTDKVVDC